MDLLYSAHKLQHIPPVKTSSNFLFKHPLFTETPVNHFQWAHDCRSTLFYPFKTGISLGCLDASVMRCSCHQALWSKFNPRKHTGRKKNTTTGNCPLAPTCTLCCTAMHAHVHVDTHTLIDALNAYIISWHFTVICQQPQFQDVLTFLWGMPNSHRCLHDSPIQLQWSHLLRTMAGFLTRPAML